MSVLHASTGFVYCIINHERKAVKIGYSRDPYKRLAQLQTGCADPLMVFDRIEGGRDLEAALHKDFESRRLAGEWFDNSDGRIRDLFGRFAWEVRMGIHGQVSA